MKKIIIVFGAVLLLATGCTQFDAGTQIEFAQGPDVEITVLDAKTLSLNPDSVIVFRLRPVNEAAYFSYLVVEADAAQELVPLNVLKLTYTGIQKETFKFGENNAALKQANDTTLTLKKLKPNTTYQIYAVASHKKGGVGKLTNANSITADANLPSHKSFVFDGRSLAITFSENLQRGTGKIFGTYYSSIPSLTEEEMLEIPEDSISVSENVLTLSFPEQFPAGANVCVTWEKGAVKDILGNEVNAYSTKGVDSTDNKALIGITGRLTAELWTLQPTVDSLEIFTTFNDFMILLTPDTTIAGTLDGYTITISYQTDGKLVTLDVPSSHVGVIEGKLAVILPEEPARGAYISLVIGEETFADKYGNGNEKLELEAMYMYSFGYELADILGTYTINAVSYFDGPGAIETNIEIVEDTVENGVIIKNLLSNQIEGDPVSEIKGVFDPNAGTISVEDFQYYGFELNIDGIGVQEMYFANAESSLPVIFDVPQSGKIVSTTMWGHNIGGTSSWFDIYASSEWTRGTKNATVSKSSVSDVFKLKSNVLKKR